MAKKYTFLLSFSAEVHVEAVSLDDARFLAGEILKERGVYEVDKLDDMHDEAYHAGAAGCDLPLCKASATSLWDGRFKPKPPLVIGVESIGREEKDG